MRILILLPLLVLCSSSSSASYLATAAAAATTTYDDKLLKQAAPPPNIVVMLADNLGYEDVSYLATAAANKHGRTRHIDSIGEQGLTFTNWNSAAHLCSASRAALLTGLYPARTGVYPGVFAPDAALGLQQQQHPTIASLLRNNRINPPHHHHHPHPHYATSIVGKWHLGHRAPYLPTAAGFDEWIGIPYHMSGGSVDNHTCAAHEDNAQQLPHQWLPLYQNSAIVQQPVRLHELAHRYASAATQFIQRNAESATPFFLYMAFSHVHQLCAAVDQPEQSTCQWANTANGGNGGNPANTNDGNANSNTADATATFEDAVAEMDWIAGQILASIDDAAVANNTIVVFTSDNGPWLAEQSCAGLRGPFLGQWLRDNVPLDCTACPHDYVPNPTPDRSRRCTLVQQQPSANTAAVAADYDHHTDNAKSDGPPRMLLHQFDDDDDSVMSLDGVHCGEDSGLGSVWEANLRMPAMVKWPGRIKAGTSTAALVSSLDLVPTLLSIVGISDPATDAFDGVDISPVLFGCDDAYDSENRVLFFWRDGFLLDSTPLGPPYGRFDVVAVKVGRIKAWYWTKSAHYNADLEQYHDPPLLFDTVQDPGEAHSIEYPHDDETNYYVQLVKRMEQLVQAHKSEIADEMHPLTLDRDPRYIPCVDPATGCRTVTTAHATPIDSATTTTAKA